MPLIFTLGRVINHTLNARLVEGAMRRQSPSRDEFESLSFSRAGPLAGCWVCGASKVSTSRLRGAAAAFSPAACAIRQAAMVPSPQRDSIGVARVCPPTKPRKSRLRLPPPQQRAPRARPLAPRRSLSEPPRAARRKPPQRRVRTHRRSRPAAPPRRQSPRAPPPLRAGKQAQKPPQKPRER